MGGVVSLVYEALVCPVTTILLLINCWVWVKVFMQEWDPRQLSLSYNDVVVKKQFWRVVTASSTHSHFGMLFLDAMALWNCRLIELNKGPLFFLRYSLLFMVSEAVLTFLIVNRAISLSHSINTAIAPLISNLNTYNSSGLVLAWLTYQSFECQHYTDLKYFVLFGVFGIHVVFAGFIMAFIYAGVSPRNGFMSNMTGIFSGCLLTSGLLQVLPDFYWSFCFIFNLAIIVLASVHVHASQGLPISTSSSPRAREEGELESMDVVSVQRGPVPDPPVARDTESNIVEAGSTADDDRDSDAGEETALLSSHTSLSRRSHSDRILDFEETV